MHPSIVVFRKEVADHLRDKRSILIALIYPLLGPLLLGVMFIYVGGTFRVSEGAPLIAPILHPENAPDLVRYLREHGVTIWRASPHPEAAVLNREAAFVLVLPERPAAGDSQKLSLRMVTNPSRFDSIVATGRIIEMLNAYDREVLKGRLLKAGLPAEIMTTLDLERFNVGQAAGPSVILLAMIPPFLIFTLFTGGVHVTLDSTSGERERGSFEPLLINPVTRNQILLGKLGAGVFFTVLALGVQALGFWVMLNAVPRESLGLTAPPGALTLTLIVAVCLPIVLLAAATQLLISAVTRSMKEAQTYLGLLPLIPGLAGMVLALAPLDAQPVLAAIPTFGQTLLMGQIVRLETVNWILFAITVVATLGATALLLRLGFRLYEREEILFPT